MNGWGPQKYNPLYKGKGTPRHAMGRVPLEKGGAEGGGTKYIGLGTHRPIGGTPPKMSSN
jgi:hypothetical protein